jgi:cytochrome c oxidase subunit 2
MPVNKVINLTLRSDDVLHSFWIPKLAGKMDVISTLPGQTNSMWIKGDRQGTFWGLCAEFCGIAHTNMKFQAVVESQAEFDSWVAKYDTASGIEVASDGAQLFASKGCTQCHSTQGPPKFDQIGPNLTLFGTRSTLAAGMLENNDHNLEKWLSNPNDVKEGNLMYREAPVYQSPNMKLTDSEILSLVNYLRNLK